jgi:hypothetical protein
MNGEAFAFFQWTTSELAHNQPLPHSWSCMKCREDWYALQGFTGAGIIFMAIWGYP